jgi:hypothetical protein
MKPGSEAAAAAAAAGGEVGRMGGAGGSNAFIDADTDTNGAGTKGGVVRKPRSGLLAVTKGDRGGGGDGAAHSNGGSGGGIGGRSGGAVSASTSAGAALSDGAKGAKGAKGRRGKKGAGGGAAGAGAGWAGDAGGTVPAMDNPFAHFNRIQIPFDDSTFDPAGAFGGEMKWWSVYRYSTRNRHERYRIVVCVPVQHESWPGTALVRHAAHHAAHGSWFPG